MTNPSEGSTPDRARLVTVVALVIAVAAGVMVGVGLHKRNHDTDVANATSGASASAVAAQAKAVLAEAGQAAVDYTSFNYLTLPQDRANAAKDFTPEFRAVYVKQSKAADPAVKAAKAVAVSHVDSIGLESFDPTAGTASVIAAMGITTKNVKSPSGALSYYRFQIPLERQADGSWLASDVKAI